MLTCLGANRKRARQRSHNPARRLRERSGVAQGVAGWCARASRERRCGGSSKEARMSDITHDTPTVDEAPPRRLVRVNEGRWLGGVAAGLGRYFDVNPLVYRIAFGALAFVGGTGAPALPGRVARDPERGPRRVDRGRVAARPPRAAVAAARSRRARGRSPSSRSPKWTSGPAPATSGSRRRSSAARSSGRT